MSGKKSWQRGLTGVGRQRRTQQKGLGRLTKSKQQDPGTGQCHKSKNTWMTWDLLIVGLHSTFPHP